MARRILIYLTDDRLAHLGKDPAKAIYRLIDEDMNLGGGVGAKPRPKPPLRPRRAALIPKVAGPRAGAMACRAHRHKGMPYQTNCNDCLAANRVLKDTGGG